MASLLTELFSDLDAVFDRTSAQWYVFGAQAAIVHGAARLTADVDITVMLGNHPIENLIQVLKEKGFEVCVSELNFRLGDFSDPVATYEACLSRVAGCTGTQQRS